MHTYFNSQFSQLIIVLALINQVTFIVTKSYLVLFVCYISVSIIRSRPPMVEMVMVYLI